MRRAVNQAGRQTATENGDSQSSDDMAHRCIQEKHQDLTLGKADARMQLQNLQNVSAVTADILKWHFNAIASLEHPS